MSEVARPPPEVCPRVRPGALPGLEEAQSHLSDRGTSYLSDDFEAMCV